MNSFEFGRSKKIREYETLHKVALWAGGLGFVQALICMGLCITALLSYECMISVEPASFGSLIGIILVQLYFKGDCVPNGYLGYNFTILNTVETVQGPDEMFIWEIVYVIVALLWLLASLMLLIQIDKEYMQWTCGIVTTWALITLCIIIMDTILGAFFSIDFDRFITTAYGYNYSSLLAGAIDANAAELMAAYVVDLILICVCFKGFLLYVANIVLMIYLLVLVLRLMQDHDTNDTLFMVRKDSDNVLDRPPINAYENNSNPTKPASYLNESYISESVETVELNQEAIVRAARMSSDVTTMERRFRNLDAYQQYPPQRVSVMNGLNHNINNNNNNNQNHNNNSNGQKSNGNGQNDLQFPVPDYTPPMSRAYQRYQ